MVLKGIDYAYLQFHETLYCLCHILLGGRLTSFLGSHCRGLLRADIIAEFFVRCSHWYDKRGTRVCSMARCIVSDKPIVESLRGREVCKYVRCIGPR